MSLRIAFVAAVAATAVAAPSASAELRPLPEVHCDPAACTYPVEQLIAKADQCVEGAKAAVRGIVQGTPQPQEC